MSQFSRLRCAIHPAKLTFMIDQVISVIAGKLNLDPGVVRSGVATVLRLIQQHAPGLAVSQLLEKIPGAAALASEPPANAGGGGLLGNLMGAASSMLGGKTGAGLEVAAELQKSGVPLEKSASFLDAFREQAAAIAGPELVSNLLSSLTNKTPQA